MKVLVLAAAIAALPVAGSAYNKHARCLEIQLQLYGLVEALEEMESTIHSVGGFSVKGDMTTAHQKAREAADDARKAMSKLSWAHADFCKAHPSD